MKSILVSFVLSMLSVGAEVVHLTIGKNVIHRTSFTLSRPPSPRDEAQDGEIISILDDDDSGWRQCHVCRVKSFGL